LPFIIVPETETLCSDALRTGPLCVWSGDSGGARLGLWGEGFLTVEGGWGASATGGRHRRGRAIRSGGGGSSRMGDGSKSETVEMRHVAGGGGVTT
jgi:hypothetical protein